VAARFDPASGRIVGRETLFDESAYDQSPYYATYDVDPRSGDLLMVATGGTEVREIHVIVNWFEELRRLVPD